jgi:hypothetical protein
VLRAPEGETAAVQGNWKADRETKWTALTGGQMSVSLKLPCSHDPMVYLTRTGLVWDWRRKFPARWVVEIHWQPYWNSRVTVSHICQAGPWRNLVRAESSQDHLGPAFLCPQALWHK